MDRITITINISDYPPEFKKLFGGKEMITTGDLLSVTEELLYTVENLEDDIKKMEKEQEKEWEEDYIPEDY